MRLISPLLCGAVTGAFEVLNTVYSTRMQYSYHAFLSLKSQLEPLFPLIRENQRRRRRGLHRRLNNVKQATYEEYETNYRPTSTSRRIITAQNSSHTNLLSAGGTHKRNNTLRTFASNRAVRAKERTSLRRREFESEVKVKMEVEGMKYGRGGVGPKAGPRGGGARAGSRV